MTLPFSKSQLSAVAAPLSGVPGLTRHLDALRNAGVAEPFRMAMRELASGVSVITTGQGENRAGLTATSVTSLSMAPPSLLVCVQKTSAALASILDQGRFAVNLLAAGQREIADRFAGRGGLVGAERFAQGDWRDGATGVPVLASALASVECEIAQVTEWQSHCVLFGAVASVSVEGAGKALVYWRGEYAAPGGME